MNEIPNESHENELATIEGQLAKLNDAVKRLREKAVANYDSVVGGGSGLQYSYRKERDDFGFLVYELDQSFHKLRE